MQIAQHVRLLRAVKGRYEQRSRGSAPEGWCQQDLLTQAVRVHGGAEHWRTLSRVQGAIWAVKGRQGLFGDIAITGETRDQRLTIAPYPGPGRDTTWEPQHQTIEQARPGSALHHASPRGKSPGFDGAAYPAYPGLPMPPLADLDPQRLRAVAW